MTTQFDAIIIGAGQSGPSLAARLAGAGRAEIIVTGDNALLALKLYRTGYGPCVNILARHER
jgi:choline dehydrogenase-like flavoprotein